MIDIEFFKSQYISFDIKDERIKNEYNLLKKVVHANKEDCEWCILTNEEKQLKRLLSLRSVKKATAYNWETFFLEESIIDLYEALKISLVSLESRKEFFLNKYYFTRLSIMLNVEILYINTYRDIRQLVGVNYAIINSLINDCLNSIDEKLYLEDSSILFLESKLKIADSLFIKAKI